MDNSFVPNEEMPAGLRMALTQNLQALNAFASLPVSQQKNFIHGAHRAGSKQEMQAYVNSLLQG